MKIKLAVFINMEIMERVFQIQLVKIRSYLVWGFFFKRNLLKMPFRYPRVSVIKSETVSGF